MWVGRGGCVTAHSKGVSLWKQLLFESKFKIVCKVLPSCGPGSSVGMATGYGLDGPGIESRWGRVFPHLSRPALGPTQPPVQWVPSLSRRVKSCRGVTLTPHPLLVPWSRKGRAIRLLPLWAVSPVLSLSACTRVHFTFTFTSKKSAAFPIPVFTKFASVRLHYVLIPFTHLHPNRIINGKTKDRN